MSEALHAAGFWVLLRMEFWKLLKRGRTYIGPLGIAAIVLPTVIAFKHGEFARDIERFMESDLVLIGSPFNALFIARAVLPPTVFFFLPLFVSLVAGDQVSGEAGDGTLRSLLVRPISRVKLLAAKFVVSLAYALFLTVYLGVLAFGTGWLFFGIGALVSWSDGLRYFGVQEGMERLLLAYSAVGVYLVAVSGVAFLLSVFFNGSLAPVGGTMAIMLVFGTLGQLSYFEKLKPWLFTTYVDLFIRSFDIPLDLADFQKGGLVLAGWGITCFLIALFIFNRKDVLS